MSIPLNGNEPRREKTLFIFLRLGTSHRNILRTAVIETLKRCPGLEIVVISPLGNQTYFREEMTSKGLVVEPLPRTRVGRMERALRFIKGYVQFENEVSSTHKIKAEADFRRRTAFGRWRFVWKNKLVRVFRRLEITEDKINRWEISLFRSRKVSQLYERYRPDAILFTKLFSTNIHVVKEAKKRGVKTICFVEGWDNLNSKGPMSVIPDDMIVWNESMKEEAVAFHNFPADRIEVVGIPEFDVYGNRSLFRSREEFFRESGLDPQLKLITYAVAGGVLAPTEPEIIELFYQAMMSGRLKIPCQLLVRLHPNTRGDYLRKFDRFKDRPCIVVQSAGRVARIQDGWDPSWEDTIRLGETMLHSDLVVTVGSTICLDAIAFDTPVVGIGFEGEKQNDYWDSYRRYYDFTHLSRVVKNGGLRVVNSLDEMVDAVRNYLDNPCLDAGGRQRVREKQIFSLDGKSGRRAGEAVLRAMGLAAVEGVKAGATDRSQLLSRVSPQ
jgi:hypothetical protein